MLPVFPQEPVPAGVDKQIWDKVLNTPLIDTHEHLVSESTRLNRTYSKTLYPADDWTIFFGSYFQSDFAVSGMPKEVIGQIFSDTLDPVAKWDLLEPYWENIEHTGYARAIKHSIRMLYGIEELNRESVPLLNEKYLALKKEGFYKHVLHDVANVEACHVNHIWEDSVFALNTPFVELDNPDLLMHDIGLLGMFSSGQLNRESMQLLYEPAGIEVESIGDWYRVIDWWFDNYASRSVAVKTQDAYHREINYDRVEKEDVEDIFVRKIDGSDVTPEEVKMLEDHLFWYCTGVATKHNLPVKMHTGFYAGADYMNLGNLETNMTHASQLCFNDQGEGRKFVFMHIAYPFQNELLAVVKHHTNAYVEMSWSWIIDHVATRNFLKQYLTIAPVNKIFVFGGDYQSVELIPGHAYMVRLGVAQVLTELVSEGYFSREDAYVIAEKIMYRNAKQFFNH
ncbi:MAG: amidohydrolase family protein [Bacteroidota bacterium]